MLTWILIAIVVAAMFGYINLEQWGKKSREKVEEAMPHIKKFIDEAKTQIESNKKEVETENDVEKVKEEENK